MKRLLGALALAAVIFSGCATHPSAPAASRPSRLSGNPGSRLDATVTIPGDSATVRGLVIALRLSSAPVPNREVRAKLHNGPIPPLPGMRLITVHLSATNSTGATMPVALQAMPLLTDSHGTSMENVASSMGASGVSNYQGGSARLFRPGQPHPSPGPEGLGPGGVLMSNVWFQVPARSRGFTLTWPLGSGRTVAFHVD